MPAGFSKSIGLGSKIKAGETEFGMSFSLFLLYPFLSSITPGNKESISSFVNGSPIILDASLTDTFVMMGSTHLLKKAPNKKVEIKITTVEMLNFRIGVLLIFKIKKLNPLIHFTFVNP